MPPGLLEEVFALNEELDEIRGLREAVRQRRSGARASSAPGSRSRPSASTTRRSCRNWRRAGTAGASDGDRRAILGALRDRFLERNYITNLLGGHRTRAEFVSVTQHKGHRGHREELYISCQRPLCQLLIANADMSKVVGIDLGTTNSLVAYVKDGAPTIIRDRARRRAGPVCRLGG